ncbi:hypothetical protein B9Z35_01615 [Limnohabitans sp. Jir61]|uniref:hypothetical protein n=1 Tax=Limnohabitans sp. Jir61 TaxID=1826168 RepID=UPI000D351B24|nr:hypothetical protein [Limnohabitans sp. Jir61]PUE32272.1 hypothetical protein B9Z35_01615 [Limnohabitans sp. Jir61]
MTNKFFYKGLPPEDRTFGQHPEQAARLARGTLYEAWFDTLQSSPWYQEMERTGEFKSDEAKKNWLDFGNLQKTNFEQWWNEKGFQIFAEKVPYTEIQNISIKVEHGDDDNLPPMLKLEIPLNLDPKLLKLQFEKILREHENYVDRFDRWRFSTAPVHQSGETKITYASISRWLKVYSDWTRSKALRPKLAMWEFALEHKLCPELSRQYGGGVIVPPPERRTLTNSVSDPLKLARRLMANATEGVFPSTDDHPWVIDHEKNSATGEDMFFNRPN